MTWKTTEVTTEKRTLKGNWIKSPKNWKPIKTGSYKRKRPDWLEGVWWCWSDSPGFCAPEALNLTLSIFNVFIFFHRVWQTCKTFDCVTNNQPRLRRAETPEFTCFTAATLKHRLQNNKITTNVPHKFPKVKVSKDDLSAEFCFLL